MTIVNQKRITRSKCHQKALTMQVSFKNKFHRTAEEVAETIYEEG